MRSDAECSPILHKVSGMVAKQCQLPLFSLNSVLTSPPRFKHIQLQHTRSHVQQPDAVTITPPPAFTDYAMVIQCVRRKAMVYECMQLHRGDKFDYARHTDLRHRVCNTYRRHFSYKAERLLNETTWRRSEWGRTALSSCIQLHTCDNIIMPINLLMVYYGQDFIDFNLPGYRRSFAGMMQMSQVAHSGECSCFAFDMQRAIWYFLHELWCSECTHSGCSVHSE